MIIASINVDKEAMEPMDTSADLTNCKACNKEFKMFKGLLIHIAKKESCRTIYGSEYDELLSRNKEMNTLKRKAAYEKNRNEILEKKRKYDQSPAKRIRRNIYDMRNRAKRNQSIREKTKTARSNLTMKDRILNFKREFMEGPTYVCQCCKRCLFASGVKILKKREIDKLSSKYEASLLNRVFTRVMATCTSLVICHNCHTTISVSKKMPRIAEANGLKLDEIPQELLLVTELEQQLIAKTLIFMKIKYLPKRMMKAMINRVVNVPLNDEDINTTVSKLPRLPNEAGVVAIELKRKVELKSVHAGAYVKPSQIRKAIHKLKELENPFYQNIYVDEEALRTLEEEPMEVDEDSGDKINGEIIDDVENATEEKLKESSTSLIPRHGMAAEMYVNDGNAPVDVNNILKLAPGEGNCNSI